MVHRVSSSLCDFFRRSSGSKFADKHVGYKDVNKSDSLLTLSKKLTNILDWFYQLKVTI